LDLLAKREAKQMARARTNVTACVVHLTVLRPTAWSRIMRHFLWCCVVLLGAGCASGQPPAPAPQAPRSEQQALVEKAGLAVEELRASRLVGPHFNDALRDASGVLIFPNLVKTAFFVGGGGGAGTLLARTPTGWSAPAFYFDGEGSFGLQFGAETGRVVFVIRNDATLDKIVNGSVDLDADVSVAAGPVGGGTAGVTTPNLGADILAFSAQKGLFAGAALQGGIVAPLADWNEAYYGAGATAHAIVSENRFQNPHAQALKDALALLP
jgi:lipid-binding SYLF domain-containing protein